MRNDVAVGVDVERAARAPRRAAVRRSETSTRLAQQAIPDGRRRPVRANARDPKPCARAAAACSPHVRGEGDVCALAAACAEPPRRASPSLTRVAHPTACPAPHARRSADARRRDARDQGPRGEEGRLGPQDAARLAPALRRRAAERRRQPPRPQRNVCPRPAPGGRELHRMAVARAAGCARGVAELAERIAAARKMPRSTFLAC